MNHLRTWDGSCTAGTVDLNEDLPVSLATFATFLKADQARVKDVLTSVGLVK